MDLNISFKTKNTINYVYDSTQESRERRGHRHVHFNGSWRARRELVDKHCKQSIAERSLESGVRHTSVGCVGFVGFVGFVCLCV